MRIVRANILAAVSRRDLVYESESVDFALVVILFLRSCQLNFVGGCRGPWEGERGKLSGLWFVCLPPPLPRFLIIIQPAGLSSAGLSQIYSEKYTNMGGGGSAPPHPPLPVGRYRGLPGPGPWAQNKNHSEPRKCHIFRKSKKLAWTRKTRGLKSTKFLQNRL